MRKERERDGDGDSTEFGSQLRNETRIKWHKSAKRRRKKKINFSAVSFAAGTVTSIQTRSHTQCHSISARHSVCVSRADRCHTALMQTGIRRASDLLPRPPRQRSLPSSPLIASTPIRLMSEKTRSHEIHTQYSRCMRCDTHTHMLILTPQVFLPLKHIFMSIMIDFQPVTNLFIPKC